MHEISGHLTRPKEILPDSVRDWTILSSKENSLVIANTEVAH